MVFPININSSSQGILDILDGGGHNFKVRGRLSNRDSRIWVVYRSTGNCSKVPHLDRDRRFETWRKDCRCRVVGVVGVGGVG